MKCRAKFNSDFINGSYNIFLSRNFNPCKMHSTFSRQYTINKPFSFFLVTVVRFQHKTRRMHEEKALKMLVYIKKFLYNVYCIIFTLN